MDEIFGSNGALAASISSYKPRASQQAMAQRIADAIDQKQHLIAEAGTGTGKTFAYLIPAILSGKKIVISTGTKNLQDQLFQNDLPIMRKVLNKTPFKAALLKGRSNYLCTYRLDNAVNSEQGFSRADASALNRIARWAGRTKSGDISEVTGVSDDSMIWYEVTSTGDNCLGQECPAFADCFLVKARRKAQEAEVLVINHHLLCADWSLRSEGFGELLPNADVVIVDEAHQLAATASGFLGVSVSARQLKTLASDIVVEQVKDAGDMAALRDAADQLADRVQDFRVAFGDKVRRGAWDEVAHSKGFMPAANSVLDQLKAVEKLLEVAAERGKGLESCHERCTEIGQQLKGLLEDHQDGWVRWFETYKRTFSLNRTPIDIAEPFQVFLRESHATWIFTSATLTVAGQFDHFITALGLQGASTGIWESPFDYSTQALFYHPRDLPATDAWNYSELLAEAVLPVLKASEGRAFFLFTSHRALRMMAEYLEPLLDYPLLIQGTHPKALLIERFKEHGNAILMATASFWEGVDVRGPALSCVIIDKLPFASPGDPVLQARLDAMRRQGKNPFGEYQLPAAVIALKQGAGRLIRDVDDRGLFMLCDRRLLKRQYGHTFLDSLPPMQRTRVIGEVETFFENLAEKSDQQ